MASIVLAAATFAGPAFAFETKPFDIATFKAAQAEGKPILIDVFAPWCLYCKAQHEIFDQLKSKPQYDRITLLKVDFDTQADALKTLNVIKQSTLIAFRGDQGTGRSVGVTDARKIEDLLLSTLK